MNTDPILDWLLEGDVSIQYQVWRDLLGFDNKKLQTKIAVEGWGKEFLSRRNANSHWGDRFYQPKWISTHYTLLDLRNLNLRADNKMVQETIELVLKTSRAGDGGIRLGPSTSFYSDVCVNGMFLNYASYFKTHEKKLHTVVDSILNERMPDGGFNCRSTRSGAVHSSLHSSLSVLEGFTTFQKAGNRYQSVHIQQAIKSAIEFILQHRLFLSDRTGKIISNDFLKFTYPCRWKYDILRALDYFQFAGVKWDSRMEPAINVLFSKRNKRGTWNMQAAHAGQVHFKMEEAGKPSRWNTLRALRILRHFKMD
ncbi:MAG: hypothetical protein IPN36_11465 [Bacteroidetes bacterium]|nr:hypothetical protein [Bacteroidota bacterium]